MRFQTSLLPLSAALCLAEEQKPLGAQIGGFFDKLKAYVPTAAPAIPNPVQAASAKVAEAAVIPLNRTNWKEVLRPGPPSTTGEPDEWMVYINGGNNTCYGKCDNTTAAWNTSAVLLSATNKPPGLATIDCEADPIFCLQWGAHPPSIYHILFPHAAGADPVVRWIALNSTNVTATSIAALHTKRGFEDIDVYTGIWNPFTGPLAKTGINIPLGYVLALFSKMPSWAPMVIISLLSRTLISRQGPRQAELHRAAQEAAGQNALGAKAPKPAAKKL